MKEPSLPDLKGAISMDDRLREIAQNERLIEGAIAEAQLAVDEARRNGDRRSEVRLLGYLGNAFRVLGRGDEAIAALEESLRGAEALGDERARAIALIRLGEAQRCRDELKPAENTLRRALSTARARSEAADLVDFALQHLGKCLLDLGRLDEAEAVLEEALVLRKAKGDDELIASTELALARLREIR